MYGSCSAPDLAQHTVTTVTECAHMCDDIINCRGFAFINWDVRTRFGATLGTVTCYLKGDSICSENDVIITTMGTYLYYKSLSGTFHGYFPDFASFLTDYNSNSTCLYSNELVAAPSSYRILASLTVTRVMTSSIYVHLSHKLNSSSVPVASDICDVLEGYLYSTSKTENCGYRKNVRNRGAVVKSAFVNINVPVKQMEHVKLL